MNVATGWWGWGDGCSHSVLPGEEVLGIRHSDVNVLNVNYTQKSGSHSKLNVMLFY